MENSIGTAIEKIKQQEQDNEAKLKEKRQYESTVTSLNRTIRDVTLQADKMKHELSELTSVTDKIQVQVDMEKLHRNVFLGQLEACKKELFNLRIESDEGITKVWNLRASLCETVQNVADEYDVWALLMKPSHTNAAIRYPKKSALKNPENELINENKLRITLERRDRAYAERDRLLSEPETGEEFIRIKNALRYSEEMTAYIRN